MQFVESHKRDTRDHECRSDTLREVESLAE
jgi:hypothetical protein